MTVRSRRKLTKQQRACLNAHARGLRQIEIATKLGISRQRVADICKTIGITPLKKRDIANAQMEQVRLLVDKGNTSEEIAKLLDLPLRRVVLYRKRLGLPPRIDYALRRKKVAELCKLTSDFASIAKILGVSYSVVMDDRAALGLCTIVKDRADKAIARRKKVAKLHAAGKHHSSIAKTLKQSTSLIYNDLMVVDPSRTQLTTNQIEQIKRLVLEHAGNAEISHLVGVSIFQVSIVVQRMRYEGLLAIGKRKVRKFNRLGRGAGQ